MATTRVLVFHTRSSLAYCDCGWSGHQRMLRSRAIDDGLSHCAASDCRPADWFVVYL